MAVPLLSSALFLDLTQPGNGPAALTEARGLSAALSPWLAEPDAGGGILSEPIRIAGIGAEYAGPAVTKTVIDGVTPVEAGKAFATLNMPRLEVGMSTSFDRDDGQHVVMRIVGRDLLAGEAAPNEQRLRDIALASSLRIVNFSWGEWLYSVAIDEQAPHRRPAVQGIL